MAGRPKGLPKTGGREVGSRNKVSLDREKEIAASGLTPLEYMLQVLRASDSTAAERMDAAKAAAQFVHPRLAAVEHKGDFNHYHHDATALRRKLLPELAGDGTT